MMLLSFEASQISDWKVRITRVITGVTVSHVYMFLKKMLEMLSDSVLELFSF